MAKGSHAEVVAGLWGKPNRSMPRLGSPDRVCAMEESFSETLAESLNGPLTDVLTDPTTVSDVMAFLVVVGVGLGMALIYVPLRLFLTITTRSRRLRLLQRIRRLREELNQPVTTSR